MEAMNEATGKQYECVETFNDDIDTSHSLLMRVLERARADLIRQGVNKL